MCDFWGDKQMFFVSRNTWTPDHQKLNALDFVKISHLFENTSSVEHYLMHTCSVMIDLSSVF